VKQKIFVTILKPTHLCDVHVIAITIAMTITTHTHTQALLHGVGERIIPSQDSLMPYLTHAQAPTLSEDIVNLLNKPEINNGE